MSMTGAMMIGPWVGGALVDFLPLGTAGAGSSYLIIVFLYLVSFIQLRRTSPSKYPVAAKFSPFTALATTLEGIHDIAKNRAAIGALGITILVNFFFFSYTPLIPVFAQNVLEVNAMLMGVLGGAQGAGALIGSMFIASRKSIGRNSNYYVYGSIFALLSLFVFSFSHSFPLSVISLMMAGFGIAGFSTMQATIILLSVKDEIRGRAMGMVNMAIGALPIGMLIVGFLAEILGPIRATNLSASFGLLTLCLWAWRSKAMREI
jgi:MFS family permease